MEEEGAEAAITLEVEEDEAVRRRVKGGRGAEEDSSVGCGDGDGEEDGSSGSSKSKTGNKGKEERKGEPFETRPLFETQRTGE